MTLHICHPAANDQRWNWLLDVVFDDWLGIAHTREVTSESAVSIQYGTAKLSIENDFLLRAAVHEPSADHLPRLPLERWILPYELSNNIEEGVLPVVFGAPKFKKEDDKADLGIDIFGAIFLVLSRYEEIALEKTDQHNRFPGTDSIAYKDRHLQYPIVDEYVEVLWNALTCVMPQLQRKQLKSRTLISCDVDEPYERWIKSPSLLVKGLAGSLVRRRSLKAAGRRLLNAWHSLRNDFTYDPNWSFDWYMKECEKNGHEATFYFIPTAGRNGEDAAYQLDEPRIENLMRDVLDRGHHIGMHGSYHSYLNPALLSGERAHLERRIQTISSSHRIIENRQHFLRWRIQETPDHLQDAGFHVDTSGTFADQVGFRFGTSRKFRMWSWKKLAALNLIQSPLVAMEGTLIDYMNLDLSTEVLPLLQTLQSRCARYGGDFSLLWHNSNLETDTQRHTFSEALRLKP
jgi:hypothetical protein